MEKKPPVPISKAFLILSKIEDLPNGEVALIGLPRYFAKPFFPAATPVAFFARLVSAHGLYQAEVQLQTPDGEVVWKEITSGPWLMNVPLELYDLKLTMCVSFPSAGQYDFVLVLNGEEVARHPFHAVLTPQRQESR